MLSFVVTVASLCALAEARPSIVGKIPQLYCGDDQPVNKIGASVDLDGGPQYMATINNVGAYLPATGWFGGAASGFIAAPTSWPGKRQLRVELVAGLAAPRRVQNAKLLPWSTRPPARPPCRPPGCGH